MSKGNIQLVLIILALLLACGQSSLAQRSDDAREEFHQSYPLAATGRLSLENINGSVRVTAWDRNEVRVDAVKKAYTRERLNDARIVVDAGPDAIHIRTEYENESLTFNSEAPRNFNNPPTVEYTLSIPRNARVETIGVVNGSVEIEGATGHVVASSVNGAVRARGLVGEVKLSTVNGPVEASFNRIAESRSISLNSVNGPLTLTIPSDSDAEVRANTLSGRISNDYGLPVHDGEYVGHELAGMLGRGGTRIRLNNVSGSISVRHAADNRPLSNATNLLSERMKEKEKEKDLEDKEAAREARRVIIERQREAARPDRERPSRDVDADAQRELQREAQRATRESQREAARAARQAQVDVERERRERETAVYGNNSQRFIDRESKTFSVSGTPRVTARTFDGPIIVRAWDRSEVMYTATKRAASEEELHGINMQVQQNGNEIRVSADFDKSAARHIAPGITNISAQVNLEVFVPRNTTLVASSGDGRLYLEGVRGDLDLHTGDGGVDVRDSSGRLNVNTGDGRIRVTGFDGVADVRTGDGGIALEGRFTQLSAKTGDGAISLALPGDANVTIETNAEDVISDGLAVREDNGDASARKVRRWNVGSGGTVFRLHTGDGRVTVRRTN